MVDNKTNHSNLQMFLSNTDITKTEADRNLVSVLDLAQQSGEN